MEPVTKTLYSITDESMTHYAFLVAGDVSYDSKMPRRSATFEDPNKIKHNLDKFMRAADRYIERNIQSLEQSLKQPFYSQECTDQLNASLATQKARIGKTQFKVVKISVEEVDLSTI